MTFEHALGFATHHSESIIQWIFFAILVMCGFLLARGLFSKGEAASVAAASAGSVGPSPELQSMIGKIMEQTAKLESLSFKEMNPAGVAQVEAQVAALKKDLQAREAEINQLKAAGPAPVQVAEDASQLSTRIKELEARLAEYEILEDDIADLSLYKEENARLKSELEKLQANKGSASPAGGAEAASTPDSPAAAASASTPAPAPTSATASAPAAAAEAEAATAASVPTEVAATASPAPAETPPSAPSPMTTEAVASSAPAVEATKPAGAGEGEMNLEAELEGLAAQLADVNMNIPDTGNPMADFENTVQLERKIQSAVQEASPATEVPPPEPVAASDDLFAEFAEPSQEAEASAGLDTDKMMAEMAQLVSIEPQTGNALEEGIDIEKMAMEADKASEKA